MPTPAVPSRHLSIFLLLSGALLLAALVYLPYLGAVPLHLEETRRALISAHMIASGDYWVPVFMDRVYTAKPPLFNWLVSLVSHAHGRLDAFSARLPSVLALMACTALLLAGLRRHLTQAGLAFVALGTLFAPEILAKTTTAEIDTTFTALVSATLWSWFWLDQRGRRGLGLWLPPAVLVALAFLTKREPALLFYYLTLGGYLLYRRRFRELFRWPHLAGAALTLGLIGLWLGTMIHRVGLEALVQSSVEEVVSRGLSHRWQDYLIHLVSYPVEILVATAPFSLFLAPLLSAAVRHRLQQRAPDLLAFATIALLANLPVYLLRGDVAVRYFMPMMPTLVILAGLVFDDWYRQAPPLGKAIPRLVGLCLLLAAALAAASLVLPGTELVARRYPLQPLLPAALGYGMPAAILAGVGWTLWRLRASPRACALPALLLFALALRLVQLSLLMPHTLYKLEREEDFRTFAQQIYARVPRDALPLQTVGWTPHGFWYAMDDGDVATPARTGTPLPRNYFVTFSDQFPQLRAQGIHWQELESMAYRGRRLVAARVLH